MVDGEAPDPQDETEDQTFFQRRQRGDEPSPRAIETWSAVLLSITVILTAWSAFQSSKWGGAMSIAFSQASSARIQANRAAGELANARQVDLSIYSLWVQMKASKNEPAADYVEARFTDRFRVAFDEWVAKGGISDPENAPLSPFDLPSYAPPGSQDQADLDTRADAKFQDALANNQRGDNYTILGVLFAIVLFFAAVSTRFVNRSLQYGMLIFASVLFLTGVAFLIAFPRLI
ncbi:MAG: hypothetical protein OEW29_04840 [Acidimicrobiia bacterium]|nr:hypothetical protein [Acidimicrobiia bacterium]